MPVLESPTLPADQIRWYAIPTRVAPKLKGYLDVQIGVVETFLPIYHQYAKDKQKVVTKTVSGYLFARGNSQLIGNALSREWPLEYKIFKDRFADLAIPSEEMQVFMTACQKYASSIFLKDTYNTFFKKEYVAVTDGDYEGYEGFIAKIANDHKLVMKVGNFSFALGMLSKNTYKILKPRDVAETPVIRMAKIIDFFKADMLKFGIPQERLSCFLNTLIKDYKIYQSSTMPTKRLQDQYDKETKTNHADEDNGKKRAYIAHIANLTKGEVEKCKLSVEGEPKAADAYMVELAAYCAIDRYQAELPHKILKQQLRPFLTHEYHGITKEKTATKLHDCTLLDIPTNFSLGRYNPEKKKARKVSMPYVAHIAVYEEGNDKVLITNWYDFFNDYMFGTDKEKAANKEKLEKKHCDTFLKVLNNSAAGEVTLQESNIGQTIYGLGIRITNTDDLYAAADKLIATGKKIIEEVSTAQGLYTQWCKLQTICIR